MSLLAEKLLSSNDMPFMQYYLKELASLEDDCAEFAACYPQVAGNLGLGIEGATDPHVRQLIESVAFIAARLKRQIDTIPGDLAYNLLQSLAPHLVAPVPAMSVARFSPLTDQLDAVKSIPSSAMRLRAISPDGECLFRTCATSGDNALWPLQLDCFWAGADASPRNKRAVPGYNENNGFVLRLEHPKKMLAPGDPDELTFFISGALNRALAAVEAFLFGVREVRMVALDGSWTVPVPLDQIVPQGFDPVHRLMPTAQRTTHAGALTLEFLTFPRRFCFLKVRGLNCPVPSRGFFLVFVMERSSMAALDAVKENIAINCLPIINLFTRNPVALRLKGVRDEYAIPRGDLGRGKWDIFNINRVRLIDRDKEREIPQYHMSEHSRHTADISWQGVRRERLNSQLGHASLNLRFIGLDGAQGRFESEMAMLDVTCTHCEAPDSLQAGQNLELLGWGDGYRAELEFVPTAYVPPMLPSDTNINEVLRILQWRSSGTTDLAAVVRQYLRIHNRTHTAYANAATVALQDIQRQVVAMPWVGNPSPMVLGMACRYVIALRSGDETISGRYLFAGIVRRILEQMHDLPLPQEVLISGLNGELRNVN